MSNILAIVGRPNVGKSTLFNRLVGSRTAIVDSVSGVTRDRHYGKSEWIGYSFSVIDTGGYVIGSDDVFESEISKQVVLAIEEADVILFMVDVNEGLNAMDEDVAALLRKSNKPVIVACNKADSSEKYFQGGDFYALGLGEVFPISAMTGTGTGELLNEIVKYFTKEEEEEDVDLPRFAVVGRPNVGKSSIINAFLGNDRNIVTPVAGTTRDSIYTKYNNFGFEFYLVDTAGVRKKSKINEDIEFYSVMRSIKTIENSDVCILMIDATQGIEAQDLNIFSLIQRNNKGVVVVVNKWDLIEKDSNTHLHYREMVADKIAPFNDVPIIFTSVLNKQRIYNVIETAIKVYENKTRKIPTSKLNDVMLPIVKETPPPVYKGKTIKIKYITQLKKDYPVFIFFCNLPQYIKDPYKRYIENKLRQNFDFKGVPMTLYFREK
ncbi:MAG: ribosome biogenesis GTPase Der [Bacteroidales bacterium]|nr:ribosome biogenesis GTPase Der [Bacteroidales bacterium]